MQSLTWYFQRLRSMDLPEIFWRIRSLIRDHGDIARVSFGLVPSISRQEIRSFSRFEPGFQVSPADHNAWQDLPYDLQSKWKSALLKKANQVLENRLSYFNLEDEFHEDPWNWHRDFSARKDCPVRLSVLTDYRDFHTFGDCKLVWEPNRHHQLVVLARAYVITADRRYADKIAELLRSWIATNPFGYGMNWKSPLELGIRLMNWIWALDLIRNSDVIDDELWFDIVNTIYRMTWDTQRKFSRGSSANNHLIGEIAGVYISCCYFPHMPNANLWRERSKALLEREIVAQTFSDGCTREHAFNYQLFVIQFFTTVLLSGRSAGDQFSEHYLDRLHSMYRFMWDISLDTGRPPNSGDSDDGYVLDLGDLPRNAMSLLAVGGSIFDDPTLRYTELTETQFWLLGTVVRTDVVTQGENNLRSSFYPESGYFILRSGYQRDSDKPKISAFFDCADLGYGPLAAHGHADCLSFCLSVENQPALIDLGTYDYFSAPEMRDYFRQTRAHNTVEIDGESQSESLGPFIWGRRANRRVLNFIADESQSSVTGEHDGYSRLSSGVIHQRTILLNSITHDLTIDDHFRSSAEYLARLFFHVAPDWDVVKTGDNLILESGQSRILLLKPTAENGRDLGKWEINDNWASDGYHCRRPCKTVSIELACNGYEKICTKISIVQ